MEKEEGCYPAPSKTAWRLEGCWNRSGGRRGAPGKSSLLPGGAEGEAPAPGGGSLLPGTPDPGPRPDTMEPAWGPGRDLAVAPSPPPAPTPAPAASGPASHRGPLPASQTPRGSRLGPAPLRLLGSRVAAAPGREGAKEEGRGREESPAGERDGGRRPKLGAAGSPRGGGRWGGGARLRRPPAGGAGGRSASPCWCPPGLSPPPPAPQRMDGGGGGGSSHGLAGLPLMRSAGRPRRGPRRQPRASGRRRDWGGRREPRAGLPPGAGVPPGGAGARAGQGATHAPRAQTSSRRVRRPPACRGPGDTTYAAYALLTQSDCRAGSPPTRGGEERWPKT